MRRFELVSKPVTVESLRDKVATISGLTGTQFQFVPGTVRGSKGYMMRPVDPEKASPFIPDGMIGRTRHEANRTLDSILAGIGFVTEAQR